MDVEPVGDRRGLIGWVRSTNRNPEIVDFVRQLRRRLPGDPDFGDPLSTTGEGTAKAAARAAGRLMPPERSGATREIGLAGLQVWEALTARIRGDSDDAEVTLVFTDLVGFSTWALKAGDEAALTLLRQVSQVAEPPLLEAGGHIVKRMGDGMMAVFDDAAAAVRATATALEAVKAIEVDGYTPRVRAGIHTGRPQHIGADWLGVDVNIAARVMERAARGGLIVSETTLNAISPENLEALGVSVKRVRRNMFAPRQAGVPPELSMYRVSMLRDPSADPGSQDAEATAPSAGEAEEGQEGQEGQEVEVLDESAAAAPVPEAGEQEPDPEG